MILIFVTHPEYQALASPRVVFNLGVTTMKRRDKGHLHPKLKVSRLACPGQESTHPPLWEASTLEKSHSTAYSFLIRYLYNTVYQATEGSA